MMTYDWTERDGMEIQRLNIGMRDCVPSERIKTVAGSITVTGYKGEVTRQMRTKNRKRL
jgi:hypothetical protein